MSESTAAGPEPGGWRTRIQQRLALNRSASTWWHPWAEVAAIVLWALWVGRAYLNLDPNVWPRGGEFGWVIYPQSVWSLLSRCGDCVLWNGSVNGGYPAFVDLNGVVLHPFVVITTLLWGAINSAKLTIVASLVMGGLAQWWLARTLRLGRVARLWSAAMAVVGGHLIWRADSGVYPLALATASAALALSAGLELALTRKRRALVGFAVTLAFLFVSGQGYMQMAFLLGIAPAFLIFAFQKPQPRPIWKDWLLTAFLTALLVGILWVPLAHFWPRFVKDVDLTFKGAQSLEYGILDLVIRDLSFFRSDALGKLPYPYLNVNYIGWIPVLLAFVAWRWAPHRARHVLAFFLTGIGLLYLASSATTLKLLARIWPTFAGGAWHSSLMSALAVPLVLGMAAWGLDLILQRDWPRLMLAPPKSSERFHSIGLQIVLVIPLILAIKSAYDFDQITIGTTSPQPKYAAVIQALATETSQWVMPPYGDSYWVPDAIASGLKIAPILRNWRWKDQPAAPTFLETGPGQAVVASSNLSQTVAGYSILMHPENGYACVETDSDCIPCQAQATGGHIDVDCAADVAGTLVVHENMWSGWTVRLDGSPVALDATGPWLKVPAPAGQHRYEFRYRPWDVPAGACLTLAGALLALVWWLRPSPVREEQHPDKG